MKLTNLQTGGAFLHSPQVTGPGAEQRQAWQASFGRYGISRPSVSSAIWKACSAKASSSALIHAKWIHSLGDFPVIRGAMGWLEAAHERHRCRRSRDSLFAKFHLNSKRSKGHSVNLPCGLPFVEKPRHDSRNAAGAFWAPGLRESGYAETESSGLAMAPAPRQPPSLAASLDGRSAES
jgi:hypothetical protein